MDDKENIIISSEFIEAQINPLGAQLKSLFDLESSCEYLWCGNSALYPWSSKILFPIVGKLRDDKYRLGRKHYHLIKDGFAKDLVFEVKNQRKDRVTLTLTQTKDTLACFPFNFNLSVTYKVYGPKLSISIEVKNMDKKEMLFSLGFAPVFNIPLSYEKFTDYYIDFEEKEERGAYYLDNDLINFHHADNKKIFDDNVMNLNDELFNNGEMVFKDIHSHRVSLKNNLNEKSVEFNFGNIPYLNIRSFPGVNFIKIAPNYGVADAHDSNHDFMMKEGLIDLEPEKSYKYEVSLHIR